MVVEEGGRLERKDAEIRLESEGSAKHRVLASSADDFAYAIRYVARATPVEVNGEIVQANDMLMSGNKAYIAYNFRGEKFLGAVQILDVSDPAAPRIEKEIKFSDIDVDGLCLNGNSLLFVGAANPDKRGFKSCVGLIDLSNTKAISVDASVKGLRSHAATAITRQGNLYYVGVGAKDGGVAVLNDNLEEVSFLPNADVRDLVSYEDGVVALTGVTDSAKRKGSLMFVAKGTAGQEIELDDFRSAYAKATLEVLSGKRVLMALSELGVVVRELRAPYASVFTLANPSESAAHTANSASCDEDLLFVANGEYGFRVLKLNGNGKDKDFASLVGFHPMDGALYGGQRQSANHLLYKARTLFVASGSGGVSIYALSQVAPGASASPSPTASPSSAPSASPAPSATPSPGPSASATPGASPSASAAPSAGPAASATPSASPSASPSATPQAS